MKITRRSLLLLLAAAMIVVFSIMGPELLSGYKDKAILNELHAENIEMEEEGYRYELDAGEKLYVLSKSLSTQKQLDNEVNGQGSGTDLSTFAFIINHRNPSEQEITDEELYENVNQELVALKKMKLLPDTLRSVKSDTYQGVLYSAIDILEPRNNIAVWKISLSDIQMNADKKNRLIEAYIDADSGKIYEFYVRSELMWDEIDPDMVIELWSEYMELPAPVPYEADNPLMETATYSRKYEFPGRGEEKTIVTIGFYEGINEYFLRISR
jgi:hypothetical protein